LLEEVWDDLILQMWQDKLLSSIFDSSTLLLHCTLYFIDDFVTPTAL
jgi:hypothetical protein